MISVATRENKARLPERPILVFREQLCPDSGSRQRPGPLFHITSLESALIQIALAKSFRMRTYKNKDLKSPGMNTYEKCTGGETDSRDLDNAITSLPTRNAFKMILLCDAKNKLPGMIFLRKKVGVTPSRAHSNCQTHSRPERPPASRYNLPSQPEPASRMTKSSGVHQRSICDA
jgi:hypothetical protein